MGEWRKRWSEWKSERSGSAGTGDDLREFWGRKIKSLLKRENLILLALSGMLLLVISLPVGDGKGKALQGGKAQETEPYAAEESKKQGETPLPSGSADTDRLFDEEAGGEEAYRKSMERELASFLETIDGVGEVKVMITLQTSWEQVALREEKAQRKSVKEEDASGGRRLTEEAATEDTVLYDTLSAEKTPCVAKTIYPRVEGVVIAATGVGTGRVRTDITETVQALFGLEAHKVKVLKMGNISFETGIE